MTTECKAASSRKLRKLQNRDDRGTGEEFWRDGARTDQQVTLLSDCFMMMLVVYSVSEVRKWRSVRGYVANVRSPCVHLPCHVREIKTFRVYRSRWMKRLCLHLSRYDTKNVIKQGHETLIRRAYERGHVIRFVSLANECFAGSEIICFNKTTSWFILFRFSTACPFSLVYGELRIILTHDR
jgi:hypothetical protein